MRTSSAAGLAALALALVLTGCMGGADTATDTGGDTDTGTSDAPYGGDSQPDDTATPASGGGSLMTAESEFGQIVVDGEGMTVYMFDQDEQCSGTSTCEGQCAAMWPAVTTDADAPEVEGVTGEVGTITGVDGEPQVTLNGWPLYYYAGDSAAGDTNGQGVNDVWWVLSPDGERIAE